jgi:adenosylcobinamide-phosphate synthase
MIGYRNQEFEFFGKFAARLDDVVNFIPARISGLLMIPASAFVGLDVKAAARIYSRDRYKHKSPNSAQTESSSAGALGIALGGDSCYKGVVVHKPLIGDDINDPTPEHIVQVNRLMYMTSVLAVALLVIIGVLVSVLLQLIPIQEGIAVIWL